MDYQMEELLPIVSDLAQNTVAMKAHLLLMKGHRRLWALSYIAWKNLTIHIWTALSIKAFR